MQPDDTLSAAPRPRTFSLRWSQTRAAGLRAAAALWLPTSLPFLFGPLRECGHCVRNYLGLLPVMPAFVAAAWSADHPWLFYGVGAAATLLLLALVATLIHVAGRHWPWVAGGFALLSGAQAIGLGYLLRM
jgi:hypothetical protein